MSIELLVDYREQELIRHLPDAITRSLPVGDIWLTIDQQPYLLLERKTVADLVSSIKDGRWHEQKKRLLQSGHTIGIIIEGPLVSTLVPTTTLVQCILNTMFRDKIPILQTTGVHDTVLWLRKLQTNGNWSKSVVSDISNIRSKRESNAQPKLVFQRQLACIPSISPAIAKAIVDVIPTLVTLQDILRTDPNRLRTIVVHRRLIGPRTIRHLINHILV